MNRKHRVVRSKAIRSLTMRANSLYRVVAVAIFVASAAGKTNEDHPLARLRTGSNERRKWGTTTPIGPAETEDFHNKRSLDEDTIAALFQMTARLKLDMQEIGEDEQVNSLSMSMNTFPPSPTPTPAVPAPEPTFSPSSSSPTTPFPSRAPTTNEPTPPRVGPPPSDLCCTVDVVSGSQCSVIGEVFPPLGECDDQDPLSRCCINDSQQVDCFGSGDSGCVTECTGVNCPDPTGIPTPSPIVDTPLPTIAPAPLIGSPTSEPVTESPTSTAATPEPTTPEPTFEPTQTAAPTPDNIIGTGSPTSNPTSFEFCCTLETTPQCDRTEDGLFPLPGLCDGDGGSTAARCCVVSDSNQISCVEPIECSVDCTTVACFDAPSRSPTELPTITPTSDRLSTSSPTPAETVMTTFSTTFSIEGDENLFQVIDGSPASEDTDQVSLVERAGSNTSPSSSPSPSPEPSPGSSLGPHLADSKAERDENLFNVIDGSPSSEGDMDQVSAVGRAGVIPNSTSPSYSPSSSPEPSPVFSLVPSLTNDTSSAPSNAPSSGIPSKVPSLQPTSGASNNLSQAIISQFSQVIPPQSIASAEASTTSTSSAAPRINASIVYHGIVTVLAILSFAEI